MLSSICNRSLLMQVNLQSCQYSLDLRAHLQSDLREVRGGSSS